MLAEQEFGGQGVHREVESEGFEENHRVVINCDEPVGQRWRMVESAVRRRKHMVPLHRTKVCADGHGEEDLCVTPGGLMQSPDSKGVSDPIRETEVVSDAV